MSYYTVDEYENFKQISEILKNTGTKEYTKDDLDFLSKVGILSNDETKLIKSRDDIFDVAMADQLRNATRRLMTSIKSPYETDKDLGLDLEDGLSSVFPINSRCVTFEIKGENSVGYLSVNPNGSMVEIFKSGDVVEEFTVSESKIDSMLKSVANNFEWQELDIEKAIKNKPQKEYDDVFYSKTGYRSLGDFVEIKMPELANQLINKYEVLDNLHANGLNEVTKFSEGSISSENLINASLLSKIYDRLKDGTQFSEKERAAYLDQMTYEDRFGGTCSIDDLNTISTKTLCSLSCYGADRLSTPNKNVAVFKLEDETAIVSVDGGIKQYKPDEPLEEYEDVYNTPELFTVLNMYYMGECKIEIQDKPEPEQEPEQATDVKNKKTIKLGR
ncbi:TPA: hypothetical protein ACJXXT_000218 [Pseudomonas aeruginosa]